ncbi:MAG: VanZ family protein [Pseudomonadota bacterium]
MSRSSKRPHPLGVLFGWALVGGIWSASLITAPQTGLEIPQEDKWGHLLAYGLLMVWFCSLYRTNRTRLWYFVGFALMGGILELIQGTLPHREASIADLIANVAGLTLGWILASVIWSGRSP